jgi:hypothetical protein
MSPVIWQNVRTAPHRWMAAWLRRRGWVCFYLDEQARVCRDLCWLQLYQAGERRRDSVLHTPRAPR